MDELTLLEPSVDYAADIWAFRQEILDSGEHDPFAGCGCLRTCTSAAEWIETSIRGSHAENCTAGKVPAHVYLAVRKSDRQLVGIIDLRHHIDHPILGTWGGHIGYSVRRRERRKGYATQMLRLNLDNARRLGLEKVLITCSADNVASEKVILANGGVYETDLVVEGDRIKRYWIDLRPRTS